MTGSEPPWQDEDALRERYVEQKLPMEAIADEFECSSTTVNTWLSKFGIETRAPSEMQTYIPEEELRRLYEGEELSMQVIGDRFDCDSDTVSRWMTKYGIEPRDNTEKCVEYMRSVPPTFHTREDGYEYWSGASRGEMWHVPVHRVLALSEHGLDAIKGKDVHHRNSIPWDNRPENVEPVTRKEHMQRHQGWKGVVEVREDE